MLNPHQKGYGGVLGETSDLWHACHRAKKNGGEAFLSPKYSLCLMVVQDALRKGAISPRESSSGTRQEQVRQPSISGTLEHCVSQSLAPLLCSVLFFVFLILYKKLFISSTFAY